jgi:hypothetical protein
MGLIHVAKYEYGKASIEFENAAEASPFFSPGSLNKAVN